MAETAAEEGTITLKVKDAAGEEMTFKVKKTTKMEKICQAYCQRKGIEIASVKFLYDGHRVKMEDTPKMYELEDGDQIDAVLDAVGGSI